MNGLRDRDMGPASGLVSTSHELGAAARCCPRVPGPGAGSGDGALTSPADRRRQRVEDRPARQAQAE
ncbi:hypothetical protein [Streptomyces dysideae]|uniref:hypothetical protein n=1 Tax=Streptomyces dysideae TaxID=909626 RepID=UPI0018FE5501|nr:hypothetical protein [Streptomyces dysideae]